MDPATARAGVISGWMGSPSIFGVVVPLTLSEPFTIGVDDMSGVVVDAAALVGPAGVVEVLLIPSDEALDAAGWIVETAAASLAEVVASRGSTAYR